MAEKELNKRQLITELTKSPHGDLKTYIPVVSQAAKKEAEFLAHLIAWNAKNGAIRDSKVALPAISLAIADFDDQEFIDNSAAHLAQLSPREFMRALRFYRSIPAHEASGNHLSIKRLVEAYLRLREKNWPWWERTAIQHRATLKALYAMFHIKPSPRAQLVLFKKLYEPGSLFDIVSRLKNMTPIEAAGNIIKYKIPFLIAQGALGDKAKDPDLVLALIKQMTPTELITNTKALEKLGVKTNPALRATYEEALEKAATSKRQDSLLKTQKAASAQTDEKLKAKLEKLQEQQIVAQNAGIDGNWLVLADKSGSMQTAIEAARHITASLSKLVKGKVHLVFFDNSPRYFDVTGKTFEEIERETRRVAAEGGTNVGCGLKYALENHLEFEGIVIASDGGENGSPKFSYVYKRADLDCPVYFYKFKGDHDVLSDNLSAEHIDFQTFDLSRTMIDYYSLPTLAKTMRVNRFSLVDEIMNTPLLKPGDVLKDKSEIVDEETETVV